MSKRKKTKKSLRQRIKNNANLRKQREGFSFRRQAFVENQIQQAWDEWYEGKRTEAVKRLEVLREHHPDHYELLETLACFAHEQGYYAEELILCRRLVEIAPERPETWYYLGSAHFGNLQAALARRVFREAVERWPEHEFAEGARGNIEVAEKMIREAQHLSGFADSAERYELAEAHEELLVELYEHRFARVVERAERLLERWPAFVPARNNLAEAYVHLGKMDQAIAVVRATTALFPDNTYAAACLVRLLAMDGQFEEAERRVRALPLMPLPNLDHLVAAVDACSRLGMHEQVLELIDRGSEYLDVGSRHSRADLHHLAAVAESNLGNRRKARERWETAIQLDPSSDIVSQNLADDQKPVAERHGAWPLETARWLRASELDQIQSVVKENSDQSVLRAKLLGMFNERPWLAPVLANILKHGGPASCQLVFGLAKCLKGGPLVEPLYDFVCGQRGSDRLRCDVVNWLTRNDLLSQETHRMWIGGEWRDIKTYSGEIYREPKNTHGPRVQAMVSEAYAIQDEDPVEAERLLREALKLEPDAPDIWNNLAYALEGQGRREEADEIVRDLQQRFPDYFFGQLRGAVSQIEKGDHESARRTLSKLLSRPRLHISEYTAAVAAYVQAELTREKPNEARVWLERLEEVDPDYPGLKQLKILVDIAAAAERFAQEAPPRRKKRQR